jgi:hypothetical protein
MAKGYVGNAFMSEKESCLKTKTNMVENDKNEQTEENRYYYL